MENLAEAIEHDKYWLVDPAHRDAVYVVALTRAQIPLARGFQARATHLHSVRVQDAAAPFCRKGRVLIATREGSDYTAVSVVYWPTFRKLMRVEPRLVYQGLLQGTLPPFVDDRALRRILGRSLDA